MSADLAQESPEERSECIPLIRMIRQQIEETGEFFLAQWQPTDRMWESRSRCIRFTFRRKRNFAILARVNEESNGFHR
jgi:hypothetical protein